jgi:hypothetical protein
MGILVADSLGLLQMRLLQKHLRTSLCVDICLFSWVYTKEWNGQIIQQCMFTFFFFLVALEFEPRTSHFLGRQVYCLSHSASPFFCDRFFQDRVLLTICPELAMNCDPPDLCLLSNLQT